MSSTEKGTLPGGVEYEGQVHREYEVREQRVGDMIAVYDDPERAKRAENNAMFMGLCILAGQIVKLGTIPKEAITPELLLDIEQPDCNELSEAAKRLEERRKTFRREE